MIDEGTADDPLLIDVVCDQYVSAPVNIVNQEPKVTSRLRQPMMVVMLADNPSTIHLQNQITSFEADPRGMTEAKHVVDTHPRAKIDAAMKAKTELRMNVPIPW